MLVCFRFYNSEMAVYGWWSYVLRMGCEFVVDWGDWLVPRHCHDMCAEHWYRWNCRQKNKIYQVHEDSGYVSCRQIESMTGSKMLSLLLFET